MTHFFIGVLSGVMFVLFLNLVRHIRRQRKAAALRRARQKNLKQQLESDIHLLRTLFFNTETLEDWLKYYDMYNELREKCSKAEPAERPSITEMDWLTSQMVYRAAILLRED